MTAKKTAAQRALDAIPVGPIRPKNGSTGQRGSAPTLAANDPTADWHDLFPAPPPPDFGGDGEYRLLPLAKIVPSPTNPRKKFAEAELEELAASIREHDVLQPILVRPVEVKKTVVKPLTKGINITEVIGRETVYELVAGERRLRAAAMAGKVVIPSRIRVLTDKQVLEIQLIENVQREGLDPIEQGSGYQRLIQEHGYTADSVAAKIGRSRSHVYAMMKLPALPEKLQTALAAGELSPSVAGLVARLPNPKMRAEAAKEIVDFRGGWMTFRDAQHKIQSRFLIELKQAPFSQQDETLVSSAGACTSCPKRAGNARDEFPDCRADVCTDPGCYEAKVKAHQARLMAAAKESGRPVLSGKESRKLFQQWSPGTLEYDSPWVDLARECHDLPKGSKPWEKLVGKQLAAELVMAEDRNGDLHRLVPKDRAMEVLRKEHGLKIRTPADYPGAAKRARQQAELRRQSKLGAAAALAANALVAAEVEKAMSVPAILGSAPAALETLRALVEGLAEMAWADACRAVSKRRDLPADSDSHTAAVVVAARASKSVPELLGMVAELVAARKTLDWRSPHYGGGGKEERDFLAAFGVRRAELVRQAELAEAARKPAKGKKPGRNGHGGKPVPLAADEEEDLS